MFHHHYTLYGASRGPDMTSIAKSGRLKITLDCCRVGSSTNWQQPNGMELVHIFCSTKRSLKPSHTLNLMARKHIQVASVFRNHLIWSFTGLIGFWQTWHKVWRPALLHCLSVVVGHLRDGSHPQWYWWIHRFENFWLEYEHNALRWWNLAGKKASSNCLFFVWTHRQWPFRSCEDEGAIFALGRVLCIFPNHENSWGLSHFFITTLQILLSYV